MAEPTPLYEKAAQAGASFLEEAGFVMPGHYGDVASEYQQAREQVAVFDVSHRGKVELTGADAIQFLHNLCTNQICQLVPGTGCEAFLTTGQAKIVGHALVYRLRTSQGQDTLWLDVAPGTADQLVKHLDRFRISEQVEMTDRTRDFVQLHLAGPGARTLLEQSLGEALDMAELGHIERIMAGTVLCQIRCHSPLGLQGYDILCPKVGGEAVWQVLTGLARPAGLEAYRILRIEAGTPVYGVDIDDSHLPQEVGRTEQAVSFTKGCYIGQETVARIRTYGHVNRSLVGLILGGSQAIRPAAKLYRDGKEVGNITSSAVSPLLGAPIALGYVRRGHQQPGTKLEVETPQGLQAAEVVPLPFQGRG